MQHFSLRLKRLATEHAAGPAINTKRSRKKNAGDCASVLCHTIRYAIKILGDSMPCSIREPSEVEKQMMSTSSSTVHQLDDVFFNPRSLFS